MPRPLTFDMVFLDHLKPLYTIDLKVLEDEGLVGPVSTVERRGGFREGAVGELTHR